MKQNILQKLADMYKKERTRSQLSEKKILVIPSPRLLAALVKIDLTSNKDILYNMF